MLEIALVGVCVIYTFISVIRSIIKTIIRIRAKKKAKIYIKSYNSYVSRAGLPKLTKLEEELIIDMYCIEEKGES